MDENAIEDFWQQHPCGDFQVGGLQDTHRGDYRSFFDEYDRYRYTKEAHILSCLEAISFSGKRTLEIGLGEGADSEQIVRLGGIWSGLDLTAESVSRVKTRFKVNNVPYQTIRKGSALSIPFDDASFDTVYSHGVLHHIPEIRAAQKEIARVLRPSGELIIMLYARISVNYLVSISLLRRFGLMLLYASRANNTSSIYGQHLANARSCGLRNYLRMENFIHKNTDGPSNPYSKVYTLTEVRKDFPDFEVIKAYKRFMHAPPLPVRSLPLQKLLGWHLWVHLRPLK